MKFYLQLTPKAKNEFLEAYDWYEKQKHGLGDTFKKDIYNFISIILENPKHYPIKDKQLREIVLKKFPFVIIYRIDKHTNTIYIASIFHTKRNPKLK